MMFQAHPGDILAGKYRVDRVLGIGGMGMVVAATHLELDQPVALKFMLGELAGSANLHDRFMREARAVAKLRSEHVCRISDVGRLDNGAPYIVMELLEGEDFSAVLAREGMLQPHVAVGYVLQAIEGVAEAHAEGIVHRDLKPGNLFITTDRDGTPLVKVLDFGISKSSSAPATRTGDVLGSPGYMAPEQMSNAKATDFRTDVWALGVILYQALTAKMPWVGESLPALCMSVISDPPPPMPASVPVELQAIVLRCLEKEPAGRWQDVGELARALARFGGADAVQTATRISKIIASTTPPKGVPIVDLTPTHRDHPRRGATTVPTSPPPGNVRSQESEQSTVAAPTPAPIRPISTISSSAAEIQLPPPPRSNTKKLVLGGGALVVVGAGIALAVGLGGSSGGEPVAAAPPAPAPAPAPGPVVEPPPSPLEVGKRAFTKHACNACHSIDGSASSGPTFAGAWGTTVSMVDGTRVLYDEIYFRESLVRPQAKVRLGFPAIQPSFDGTLSEDEIVGLMAYSKSLASVKVELDCQLPGKLDSGGKQAAEYRCRKIDFKTKACQCADGVPMRTPADVAICYQVPAGCPTPVAEPVAATRPRTTPTATTTTTTTKPPPTTTTTTTTPPKPDPKPDEMWMQMTHDPDKKK